MPNLFGLSKTAAINAINQAGLNVGNQTTTDTNDQNNQENVTSQSLPSGELVDYETTVNFNYQVFSFTPYSFYLTSFKPPSNYGLCISVRVIICSEPVSSSIPFSSRLCTCSCGFSYALWHHDHTERIARIERQRRNRCDVIGVVSSVCYGFHYHYLGFGG